MGYEQAYDGSYRMGPDLTGFARLGQVLGGGNATAQQYAGNVQDMMARAANARNQAILSGNEVGGQGDLMGALAAVRGAAAGSPDAGSAQDRLLAALTLGKGGANFHGAQQGIGQGQENDLQLEQAALARSSGDPVLQARLADAMKGRAPEMTKESPAGMYNPSAMPTQGIQPTDLSMANVALAGARANDANAGAGAHMAAAGASNAHAGLTNQELARLQQGLGTNGVNPGAGKAAADPESQMRMAAAKAQISGATKQYETAEAADVDGSQHAANYAKLQNALTAARQQGLPPGGPTGETNMLGHVLDWISGAGQQQAPPMTAASPNRVVIAPGTPPAIAAAMNAMGKLPAGASDADAVAAAAGAAGKGRGSAVQITPAAPAKPGIMDILRSALSGSGAAQAAPQGSAPISASPRGASPSAPTLDPIKLHQQAQAAIQAGADPAQVHAMMVKLATGQ